MPRLVVAPIAAGVLQSILGWSQETFGDAEVVRILHEQMDFDQRLLDEN